MKLSDLRAGLLACSGMTWGGGEAAAVITVGESAVMATEEEEILGDDLRRNEFLAGNADSTTDRELFRFCGSVFDFSLPIADGPIAAAGDRLTRSVKCKMFVLLRDFASSLIGVEVL